MKVPLIQHSPNQAIIEAGIPSSTGRVEIGAPIQSNEEIIWEGGPAFSYSLPSLVKSALFFCLWATLFGNPSSVAGLPLIQNMLPELQRSLKVSTQDLSPILGFASYPLLFFMFLNVLKVIKVLLFHVNTGYTFTTQRIVVRTGIFNISSRQIELFRLKDFSLYQSLWARICGYVHMSLISSDRIMPNTRLLALPNRTSIADDIRRAAQIARAKSGTVSIGE